MELGLKDATGIYWIYALPIWLFGVLTVLVFCAFGITGLAATRRWAPSLHHATLSYNNIVGYYFGAITVLCGITLGLLMVGAGPRSQKPKIRLIAKPAL